MTTHSMAVTFNDGDKTLLARWTIKNFSNVDAERIESPIFSHNSSEVDWRLALTRNFVKDNSASCKYVKVTIYAVSPPQVSVKFTMDFEEMFSASVRLRKYLRPKLISLNGLYLSNQLVKSKNIGNYLKDDGSLVFVVWMDYGTLACDRDWNNSRLSMSQGLSQALDGKYSDITFKVDNMTIKAHKVIVSRCKYFEAMFDGSYLESSTNVIEITDFKFAIVRGLLEYIYTGWIVLKSVNFAIDLRMAADKYDLPGLGEKCENYIARRVSPIEVTKAILSTTVLESLKIKEACAKLIKSNPKDIVDCGTIFDNAKLRVYLLKSDK